ncbi:MAG: hypothetical protein V3U87_07345 [Methylococcaceae bacterium]
MKVKKELLLITSELLWIASEIVLLSILLMGGLLFVWIVRSTEVNLELPQHIGGTLIVTGDEWMDLQSFGDNTKIRFKPKNSQSKYLVGESDYYGRNFDESKQIIIHDGIYMLSVGNRLNGDKIYASKDLKDWKEFTFSRESLLANENDKNISYLRDYSDEVFINDNLKLAEMIRSIKQGSDIREQKIRFSFILDWENQLVICNEIVETIDNLDF